MSLIVAVNKTYHSYFSPKHIGTLNPKKKYKPIVKNDSPSGDKAAAYQKVKDYKNPEKRNFYARDIMSKNIHSIRPEDLLEKAVEKMNELSIHHLIVLENKEVVGLVSDRDLLKNLHTSKKIVNDVMNEKVLLCHLDTEVRLVAKVLFEEQISSIIVSGEGFEPLGIITRSDLLNFIVQQMPLEMWR